MSQEDVRPETRGLSRQDDPPRASTVYQGHRDSTAPVGEEYIVTVDDQPLPKRYDLLSASPSGFSWAFSGSGPAQLAIAILAHAYDDEFAADHHQLFKREVVSELPKDGWKLDVSDLDAWREVVIDV